LASLFCLLAIAVGTGIGALGISPSAQLSILAESIGLDSFATYHEPIQATVLKAIRLPRVVLGLLVGACLSVAGVLMQALFRNPLASPQLIGVSGGAALAAGAVIALLPGELTSGTYGAWVLPAGAFLGALAVSLITLRVGHRGGTPDVVSLLLAGVAINALTGAGLGLLVFVADDAQLRSLTFWSLGSLGSATWTVVGTLTVATTMLLVFAWRNRLSFDLLLLGHEDAHHLGVPVVTLQRRMVLVTAVAVGSAVAFTGIIGFVGLVVPHLCRLLVGPTHQHLIPLSALVGGSLLIFADTGARTLVAPAELPLGVLTTLLGAPFFLILLARARNFA
jgi:iron complex transport system permease protein